MWITTDHDTNRLGFIPSFVSDADPRPAKEQFDSNYISGWQPFPGFKMTRGHVLHYTGDNPLKPIAMARLRDEIIVVYPYAWVAIIQPDSTFEVCRMD
jgi:hypothetical protein